MLNNSRAVSAGRFNPKFSADQPLPSVRFVCRRTLLESNYYAVVAIMLSEGVTPWLIFRNMTSPRRIRSLTASDSEIYSDSQLSVQESIDLEWSDWSPLSFPSNAKRRQVAPLQMALALITHLKNAVSPSFECYLHDIGGLSIHRHGQIDLAASGQTWRQRAGVDLIEADESLGQSCESDRDGYSPGGHTDAGEIAPAAEPRPEDNQKVGFIGRAEIDRQRDEGALAGVELRNLFFNLLAGILHA